MFEVLFASSSESYVQQDNVILKSFSGLPMLLAIKVLPGTFTCPMMETVFLH
jgi:hypothetical protein